MINIYLILSLITFSIIFIYKKQITEKLGIIDKPDKKRKLHKQKTSTIAGLLLSIILIFFFLIFSEYQSLNNYFIFSSILYFLVMSFCGLLDDSKGIKPNNKLIIFVISTLIFLLINDSLVVKKIYIEYFDKEIYLFGTSIFFTTFCILLLINSFNLIDGENGIFLSYMIFLYLMFFFNNNFIFNFYLILMFVLLICNTFSIFFSGNSGTNIGSSFFAVMTLYFYNFKIELPLIEMNLTAEKIFLLFIIPGIDMLRVFIERYLNKKHPFNPDTTHLHHLFNKMINKKYVYIPYISLCIAPYLISTIGIILDLYLILITLCVYFILLIKLKKSKRNFIFF